MTDKVAYHTYLYSEDNTPGSVREDYNSLGCNAVFCNRERKSAFSKASGTTMHEILNCSNFKFSTAAISNLRI
jgi:sarcosine oxidase delta subunit